ncbi:MAG: NAD(P)/FAD-dependent oxidoreductase [Clostridia bacterium]|nr:NAD(P)/FAD-dependent oxidoreductase [Clostridia bacterium]
MFDVAIVGGGPAGIQAALNVKIRALSMVMFSGPGGLNNVKSAKEIPNVLGFPNIKGETLAGAYEEHMRLAGILPILKPIDHIYPMGDYYVLTSGDEMWEARSVILTTGVMSQKPLPGEEELIGRGVSYCATCDGMLYKGGKVIVLGYEESAAEECEYLLKLMDVTYFPLHKNARDVKGARIIADAKPISIRKAEKGVVIETDKGEFSGDCVFIFRSAIAPGTLLPGLETENGHIPVSRDMSTNLPGVFAAGDVTGLPYQIAKAIGEGATAGLSANKYIQSLPKE